MEIITINPKPSTVPCGEITKAFFAELGIEVKIVPIRN